MTILNAKPLIGIVGPCAAGKSILLENLKARGIEARHIAQEHSYVPDMWKRITNPDILIYLDVSFPVASFRRNLNWISQDYEEQLHRLRHARVHAHIYIHTDDISPDDVVRKVLDYINAIYDL